jgi:GlpG protein
MRQIGTLPDKDAAKRLSDYLLTLGITSKVDERPSGFQLWVHHEDKVPRAKQELEEFLKEPLSPRYQGVEQTARELRKKKEEEDRRHLRNSVALRGMWSYRPPERVPVTMLTVAVSIVVFVFFFSGPAASRLSDLLWIAPVHVIPSDETDPIVRSHEDNNPMSVSAARLEPWSLSRIRHGEIWRVVSPIVVHFGIWHLVFCLYWFNDIAGMVEIRKGSLWFAGLLLAIAIPSNLAQYFFAGPRFGGLFPVILGLFAYVWIQKQYIPNANFPLRANTEMMLGLGFLISITGWIFGPSNGVGAIVAIAIGLLLGTIPVAQRRWRLGGRK